MPEKSNGQQGEPQQADLKIHANLSAIHHDLVQAVVSIVWNMKVVSYSDAAITLATYTLLLKIRPFLFGTLY